MPDLFERPPIVTDRIPCTCGHTRFRVLQGVGPHAAGLRCDNCERFQRWLSKSECAAIRRGQEWNAA